MRALASCLLLSCLGCGDSGEALPPVEYPEPLTRGVNAADEPGVAENVTPVELVCAEGAQDACNGVDEDCDGTIDEGCGVETGALQVSLAWNSGADLDLEVSGPSEVTRDHEGRGGCASDAERPRIENAATDDAEPGTYEIAVRFADACDWEGVTTASVSVAAGGRTFGPYNRTIEADELAPILTIALR